MTKKSPSLKNVWITLGLPPVIFLFAIILALIYYGAQGQTDPGQISQLVANSMSVILVPFPPSPKPESAVGLAPASN